MLEYTETDWIKLDKAAAKVRKLQTIYRQRVSQQGRVFETNKSLDISITLT